MFLKKQDEVNPDDKLDGYNVPEEEINVVEDFLNMFLIMPESVQKDGKSLAKQDNELFTIKHRAV